MMEVSLSGNVVLVNERESSQRFLACLLSTRSEYSSRRCYFRRSCTEVGRGSEYGKSARPLRKRCCPDQAVR